MSPSNNLGWEDLFDLWLIRVLQCIQFSVVKRFYFPAAVAWSAVRYGENSTNKLRRIGPNTRQTTWHFSERFKSLPHISFQLHFKDIVRSPSILGLDLHLDRTCFRVCSSLERFDGIFEMEIMGDKLLYINDTALYKLDSSWECVAVLVSKL